MTWLEVAAKALEERREEQAENVRQELAKKTEAYRQEQVRKGAALTQALRAILGEEAVAQMLGTADSVILEDHFETDDYIFFYATTKSTTMGPVHGFALRRKLPDDILAKYTNHNWVNTQVYHGFIRSAAELGEAIEKDNIFVKSEYQKAAEQAEQDRLNAEARERDLAAQTHDSNLMNDNQAPLTEDVAVGRLYYARDAYYPDFAAAREMIDQLIEAGLLLTDKLTAERELPRAEPKVEPTNLIHHERWALRCIETLADNVRRERTLDSRDRYVWETARFIYNDVAVEE